MRAPLLGLGESPSGKYGRMPTAALPPSLSSSYSGALALGRRQAPRIFGNITISDSGVMASLRTYDVLAAYLAASAVGDAIPMPFVTQVLDAIDFPPRYRWIFAPIKAAAAIGLLSARWSPGLARLTTAMLTIYFALAVGFHVKARDLSVAAVGAAANTALFAALTLKEPAITGVRAARS